MRSCCRQSLPVDPRLGPGFAAATERTLTQLIEDALRETLARRAAAGRSPRIELPVLRGSGLQPGVNLDSNAALLDLMEGTE